MTPDLQTHIAQMSMTLLHRHGLGDISDLKSLSSQFPDSNERMFLSSILSDFLFQVCLKCDADPSCHRHDPWDVDFHYKLRFVKSHQDKRKGPEGFN